LQPFTIPSPLKKGDEIIMLSPAKKISREETAYFSELCDTWGLQLIESPHCYATWGQFAGTDAQRLADLQWALNHLTAKAIICSRGGYGISRIIDMLDFSLFIQKPKWIFGFSDVTNLHLLINGHLNLSSVHSPMPLTITNSDTKKQAVESMRKALFGEPLGYSFPANKHNRIGNCKGEIIGGNLSILLQAAATKNDLIWDNKILFLEEVNESLYHVDRMLVNLKRRGVFSSIKALIIGGFTDVVDNGNWFEQDFEKLVLSHVQDSSYPVCFDFPAGHIYDNRALLFNYPAELEVNERVSNLRFNKKI